MVLAEVIDTVPLSDETRQQISGLIRQGGGDFDD